MSDKERSRSISPGDRSPRRSWSRSRSRSYSHSKSRSPARSKSRSRSPIPRSKSHSPLPKSRSPSRSPDTKRRNGGHSRSHSRTPHRRSRKKSYSRSRSRSRSHSRSKHSRRYSRSRSRSYHSRSRSRSYSPRYRRSPSPHHRRRHGRRHSRSRSPMSNRRRHQGDRYNPKESRVLGVFGLSLYTGEKDLKEMFGKYGPLEEVQVVYDHQTGRSRGFGFVYFEDAEDSVDAKEHCNGIELDGRRIRVDYSITKRAHTPTPGVYMGKPTRPGHDDRPSFSSSSSYHDNDGYDRGYSGSHSSHSSYYY